MAKLSLELAKARREFDLLFDGDLYNKFSNEKNKMFLINFGYFLAVLILACLFCAAIFYYKQYNFQAKSEQQILFSIFFVLVPPFAVYCCSYCAYTKLRDKVFNHVANTFQNLCFLPVNELDNGLNLLTSALGRNSLSLWVDELAEGLNLSTLSKDCNLDCNIISNQDIENANLIKEFNTRTDKYNLKGHFNDVNFKITNTSLSRFGEEYKYNSKIGQGSAFLGFFIKYETNNSYKNTLICGKKFKPDRLSNGTIAMAAGIVLFIVILFYLYFLYNINIISKEFLITFLISLITICFIIYFVKCIIYNNIKNNDTKENGYNVLGDESLATSEFFDILEDFKQAFKTKDIACAFYENNVFFAIPANYGMFKLFTLPHNLFKKKTYEPFFKTMEAIYTAADYFSGMKD